MVESAGTSPDMSPENKILEAKLIESTQMLRKAIDQVIEEESLSPRVIYLLNSLFNMASKIN